MRVSSSLFLSLLAYSASSAAAFKEGDSCGVKSADFIQYNFAGDFLVAGEAGCALEDQTNCFCAPNYGDGESLSEWKWQCNDVVKFGPVSGKTCPANVPIDKGPVDELTSSFLGIKTPVPCDISLHPTGQQVDPVCSYSTCDEGGDMSAICACIKMDDYGLQYTSEEESMQWFCMHSTCSCTEKVPTFTSTSEPTSAATSRVVASGVALSVVVAAFATLQRLL